MLFVKQYTYCVFKSDSNYFNPLLCKVVFKNLFVVLKCKYVYIFVFWLNTFIINNIHFRCWTLNENQFIFWVIRGPITASILVNNLLFLQNFENFRIPLHIIWYLNYFFFLFSWISSFFWIFLEFYFWKCFQTKLFKIGDIGTGTLRNTLVNNI